MYTFPVFEVSIGLLNVKYGSKKVALEKTITCRGNGNAFLVLKSDLGFSRQVKPSRAERNADNNLKAPSDSLYGPRGPQFLRDFLHENRLQQSRHPGKVHGWWCAEPADQNRPMILVNNFYENPFYKTENNFFLPQSISAQGQRAVGAPHLTHRMLPPAPHPLISPSAWTALSERRWQAPPDRSNRSP